MPDALRSFEVLVQHPPAGSPSCCRRRHYCSHRSSLLLIRAAALASYEPLSAPQMRPPSIEHLPKHALLEWTVLKEHRERVVYKTAFESPFWENHSCHLSKRLCLSSQKIQGGGASRPLHELRERRPRRLAEESLKKAEQEKATHRSRAGRHPARMEATNPTGQIMPLAGPSMVLQMPNPTDMEVDVEDTLADPRGTCREERMQTSSTVALHIAHANHRSCGRASPADGQWMFRRFVITRPLYPACAFSDFEDDFDGGDLN